AGSWEARSDSPDRGMRRPGLQGSLCVGRVGRREPSITGKWLSIRNSMVPCFYRPRTSTRAPLVASSMKPTGHSGSNSRIEPWRAPRSRNETLWNVHPRGSLRLDAGGPDHLTPLVGLFDEPTNSRPAHHAGSQGGTVAPAGGNTCAPRSVRLDLKAPAVPRLDTDHTGQSISLASMPARAAARSRFRELTAR